MSELQTLGVIVLALLLVAGVAALAWWPKRGGARPAGAPVTEHVFALPASATPAEPAAEPAPLPPAPEFAPAPIPETLPMPAPEPPPVPEPEPELEPELALEPEPEPAKRRLNLSGFFKKAAAPVTLESEDTPIAFRALTVEFAPEATGDAVVAVKPKRDYAALKEELHTDPAKLGYAPLIEKQDYEGIAKLLNTVPMVPNPEPQGTQPRRLKLHAIVKKMTLAEALDFYKVGKLVEHVERTLEPKDRAQLIDLMNICDPFLSDATEAKLDTLLNETIPDEDWPATVPGPSRATVIGWPTVLPSDVQQVLG